jgi:Fe-S cluster biosynthesis and repair protein YggX
MVTLVISFYCLPSLCQLQAWANVMKTSWGKFIFQQILLLNEAAASPCKHDESHKVLFNSVQRGIFFKTISYNSVLFTTITGAEKQIVLKFTNLFVVSLTLVIFLIYCVHAKTQCRWI